MRFSKYQALGNDYIVLDPKELQERTDEETIKLICHRNFGVGSDGILLGPFPSAVCDFKLQIFNPDGSEAEKSGNGLRIFSRFLWDLKLVSDTPFTVETLGGPVTCRVTPDGRNVTVEMGSVSFESTRIPVTGTRREVLKETMTVAGNDFEFCAATVGNPHCVVLCPDATADIARKYGPLIENDPRFPHRTNVQFMEVIDRENIRIEIWERGAGYTLASGSSSTAAAAVAHKLQLCDSRVTVHMPGGKLNIQFRSGFAATMYGPVVKVFSGCVDEDFFSNSYPLGPVTTKLSKVPIVL